MTDSKALIERLRDGVPVCDPDAGNGEGTFFIDDANDTMCEAADHIEKLEADNARLRRDKETLLTFAQAIQTWRSDADSYDRECEHPQRNYCEDVELMEKAAGYALRRVAERAALQEPKP